MNCEECQGLLSDFLDGELSGAGHASLSAHLEECLSCLSARDELDSIVSFCRDCRGEDEAPPNERALWIRIRNTIEAEQGAAAAATVGGPAHTARRQSRWARIMDRSWELSLSQMMGAIVAIVIAVALATIFGIHSMQGGLGPNRQGMLATDRSGQGQQQPMTPSVGALDERMRQQQLTIEYWNQRVEQRKARWNPQVREAFERNVSMLDQTVEDSRRVLIQNPHDEVYEEMLNTALNDKMELLKEFSDM
jgi:hypothetical protein